jgi:hypothetical protein
MLACCVKLTPSTEAVTVTVPPLVLGSTTLAVATPLVFVTAIGSKIAPPLAPLSVNVTPTPETVRPCTVTERFTVAAGLPVRVDGESVRVEVVSCVTVILLDVCVYPLAVAVTEVVLLGNVKVAELPLRTGLGEKVIPVALSVTGTFDTLALLLSKALTVTLPLAPAAALVGLTEIERYGFIVVGWLLPPVLPVPLILNSTRSMTKSYSIAGSCSSVISAMTDRAPEI